MSEPSGHRSLAVKLSILMTIVVTATVVAVTIQSARKFSAYILQNIEESSTTMAERTAADLAGTMNSWADQLALATTKIATGSQDVIKNDQELSAILKANSDLCALGLFSVSGSQSTLVRYASQGTDDHSSEGKPCADMLANKSGPQAMVNFAADAAANPGQFIDSRVVKNITPETKSPAMILAVRFSIQNQPNRFAMMVLVASMTKLQVTLPQSRHTAGYIIGADGSVFVSADETMMSTNTPVRGNALIIQALKRQSPSGFMAEFIGHGKEKKIGSFAQFPGKIPLYAIVERNRDAAFQAINKMYITSALSGLLILLIAAMAGFYSAGTVTGHLRELVQATKKIAKGDFSVRLQPTSGDEVAELGLSVNHMASRITALMSSEVDKARFEKELETARMVQSTFFPKADIIGRDLSVTGSYQPATECGGDLWGHYKVSEGVELVFIADAMGHGAPAALVTAIAYAVCQSISSILKENSNLNPSPDLLLRRLNHIILDAVDGKISMTFFAAMFDFNTGVITYSNAGHNFPFILTGDADDPRLTKAAKKAPAANGIRAISLNLQGSPLGIERDAEFKLKTIDMRAGDKLFLFTDGLIENHLKSKEPLGRKDLIETVCDFGKHSIDEIKDKTLDKTKSIFGTENLQDDVTIVLAQISPTWAKGTGPAPLAADSTPVIISMPVVPSLDLISSAPETSPPSISLTEDPAANATFQLTSGDGAPEEEKPQNADTLPASS